MAFFKDDEEALAAEMAAQQQPQLAAPMVEEAPDPIMGILDSRRKAEEQAKLDYEANLKPSTRNYVGQALAGLGAALAGRDGAQAVRGIQDQNSARAKTKYDQQIAGVNRAGDDALTVLKIGDQKKAQKMKADMLDPKSAYNIAAVSRKAKLYGIDPAQVVGLVTDAEMEDYKDRQLKEKDIAANRELAKATKDEDRAFRREMAQQSSNVAAESKVEANRIRQLKEDDKQVQGLQKAIEGTQGLNAALGEVEQLLGGGLDDFDVKDGSVKLKGKEVDLPGVSIPGIGRTSFYSGKARNLAGAAARVFNATLKDRSGAAVTTPEMDRLKEEFNAGKFNTEADMIAGLKRYKRLLNDEVSRRAAAFRPEVREQYIEQGGYIPNTQSAAPTGLPADKAARLEELRAKKARGELK